MRLAIVRQRYTPYGGAERFIENALEALLERNVAITLYTREWPKTNLQLMEPQIVNPFHLGRLWRDISFAFAVCRRIRRAQPELVQSHERLSCCDVFRAGDGVHAVWLDERCRIQGPLRRLATATSPYHRYVLRKERALFASPTLAAIDALADLPAPAHLVIVGRESRMAPYARHARERGVAGRVTFAGPQQDPKPYFGAADAFVLPTLYDPLPNAVLEAMACAMPVI